MYYCTVKVVSYTYDVRSYFVIADNRSRYLKTNYQNGDGAMRNGQSLCPDQPR